jgi:aminodeoxyfutalosine deaminase
LRKLRSDIIHTGHSGIIEDHIIIVEEDGRIIDVNPLQDTDLSSCEYYPGMLCPGFINAHCHLELSHLKNQFKTGLKLIPFLRDVVQQREADAEYIEQCISAADAEMLAQGVVAVGDISNKTDTLNVKQKSPIHYHTFVEAFDFLQEDLATQFFDGYKKVYDAFEGLSHSMVPHAPYSVSTTLFSLIRSVNGNSNCIQSIHNQETPDEDLLFLNKRGGFIAFWESFGFKLDAFKAIGKESVYYAMEHMSSGQKTLFVHNTQMQEQQIRDVMKWNAESYFVTCPNANLFIENKLPEYHDFIKAGAKMCIGTDSLCSNWQLSVLEEIKTILKYNAWLNMEDVFAWATHNGALALSMNQTLGSISKHKKPGIIWIKDVYKTKDNWRLGSDARVKRIV